MAASAPPVAPSVSAKATAMRRSRLAVVRYSVLPPWREEHLRASPVPGPLRTPREGTLERASISGGFPEPTFASVSGMQEYGGFSANRH